MNQVFYNFQDKRYVFGIDDMTETDFFLQNPHGVPLVDAVSAALMAKELNNEYIKREGKHATFEESEWVQQGPNDTPREVRVTVTRLVKVSNRTLMQDIFFYHPELLAVKKAEAQEMLSALQLELMFRVLASDGENSYEGSLSGVIAKENLRMNDFSVLAYAPYFLDKLEHERSIENRAAESSYIGRKGDSVTLVMEIVNMRRSAGASVQSFGGVAMRSSNYYRNQTADQVGWNIQAITDDGNLVSFFTSKDEIAKTKGWFAVKAKIKEHQIEWKYKKYKETRLSHVKVICT